MALDRRALLRAGVAGAALAATATRATGDPPVQSRVDVRDFGAKGDGAADDTRAIQAAIDEALRRRIVAVHVPPGRYRTTDTIHLGYGETFVTLALVGAEAPSFAAFTAGTVIVPDRTDRPAINIQGARMSAVRNIGVLGRNHDFLARKIAAISGVADPDPANWLDPTIEGGLRRHAPYAAITVDAYAAPPRPGGYPAPPQPPWQHDKPAPDARALSSDVTIERCWIGGFAVGVAVHPADSDGNGDFVRLGGIIFHNCVYGVAIGNSQSRNVAIRDCSYARVHTFLTNRHFGRGIGTLGGPVDNLSGAYSYQTLDVFAARSGPIVVSALYFESQVRLGVWSNNSAFNEPLTFQGGKFGFYETETTLSPGALLECGSYGAVRFVGCTFHGARRVYHPVRGASHVALEACLIAHLFEHLDENFYRDAPAYFARAVNYTCGGLFLHKSVLKGECRFDGGIVGLDIVSGRRAGVRPRGEALVAVPDQRVVVHHYARAFVDRFGRTWTIRHRRDPTPWDKGPDGRLLRRIAYSAPDRVTVELTSGVRNGGLAAPEPGDLLYDAETATVLVVMEAACDQSACRLLALQMNNLVGPQGALRSTVDVAARTGVLWHYPTGTMIGDRVFFGSFTAGSATVTSLHPGNGSATGLARCLAPGDLLHHVGVGPPLPGYDRPEPYSAGTRIVSVDEARGTVELDRPAAATARYLVSTLALS